MHSFNPSGTVRLLLFFVHKTSLIFNWKLSSKQTKYFTAKTLQLASLSENVSIFWGVIFHKILPVESYFSSFILQQQQRKEKKKEVLVSCTVLYSIWEAHQPSTEMKLFKGTVNRDVNIWKAESTGKELFFKVLFKVAFANSTGNQCHIQWACENLLCSASQAIRKVREEEGKEIGNQYENQHYVI